MSRSKRKIDHIQHALGHERAYYHPFDEMDIIHQSLTNLDMDQLNIAVKAGELSLSSPLYVNAMTGGGGKKTEQINHDLALAARETGIGIAVGSQMSALKNREERSTYEIVRKVNPDGIVFANVGSEATVEQAKEAVEMLQANALQIHLNTLQELIMPEGDRNFKNRLDNIQSIVESLPVPVIVKEVGYGISKETAGQLKAVGVKYLDVGGSGGTNFSKVENLRRDMPYDSFENWGIASLHSLIEVRSEHPELILMGSGGIRNGLDGVKCLVAGGDAFGMAGTLLRVLIENDCKALISRIEHIHQEIRMAMILLNEKNIENLKGKPHVFYGKTKEWYDQRVNR